MKLRSFPLLPQLGNPILFRQALSMREPIHLSFEALVDLLGERFEQLPDSRLPNRLTYPMRDAMLSAFAIFFFQHPSLLAFQEKLKEREGLCNLETIFSVKAVPSDTQLREILDGAPWEEIRGLLPEIFERYRRSGWLTEFRSSEKLGDRFYPIAIDGTDYFSSTEISCEGCLHFEQEDSKTRYRHSILAATLIKPRSHSILPLDAEPILNTDGREKQDCEINAAKRLVGNLRREHPRLKMLIVGDSNFAHEPMIALLKELEMPFVLTVKPGSQGETYAWVEDLQKQGGWVERGEWSEGPASKRRFFEYRICRRVPLSLARQVWVNFVEVWEKNKAGKQVYHSAYVTDLEVRGDNVGEIIWIGRGKWKIENEQFNVHKNGGYELEHNYGHGKKTLAIVFYFLNLLAFVAHKVLERSDRLYKKLRERETLREMWNGLRYCFRRFIAKSWKELLRIYNPRVVEGDG